MTSVEGIYGRHNREYNLSEVKDIMESSGFDVINAYTISLYPYNRKGAIHGRALRECYYLASDLLVRMGLNIGDHIFCTARKIDEHRSPQVPGWLYRASPGMQSIFK
jgi:hypothetical protein